MEKSLRILIAGDHHLIRRSLSMLMSRRHDIQVVGQAATAAEAMAKAEELQPDVVVLDTRLPDCSGVECCREIRSQNPRIKVLILTSFSDDEAVIGSIVAGASGYLLKEIRSQEVIAAVRKVGRGRSLLDPAITRRVLERVCQGTAEDDCQLTPQEQQILGLIADGNTNKEIASMMSLSDMTVKNHISTIWRKLEAIRRSQAAAYITEWRMRRTYGT